MRRSHRAAPALLVPFLVLTIGCDDSPAGPESSAGEQVEVAPARGGPTAAFDGPFTFGAPVFDIDAAPDGGILVVETVPTASPPQPGPGTSISTVSLIRRNGRGGIREVVEVSTVEGSPVNGITAIGRGHFLLTSGGLDLAVGAGVIQGSEGGARLVGDIEGFETDNDPDANLGLAWKNPACEAAGPFTAGPQSNPYHLTRLSGSTVLVADAAGNSLLGVEKNGDIEVVATFSPPVLGGGASSTPGDWLPLPVEGAGVDCYVQPVPTSVAIGPDGNYYVGELTGLTLGNFGVGGVPTTGLSRVWRVAPGDEPVSCPSADCAAAFTGFTSIIDVAVGPDGTVYVLEYDENGWAPATGAVGPLNAAGGTLNACDPGTGSCSVVPGATELVLPGAIAFDKWGGLWLLENNIGIPAAVLGLTGPDVPTVRGVALP